MDRHADEDGNERQEREEPDEPRHLGTDVVGVDRADEADHGVDDDRVHDQEGVGHDSS